MAEIVKPPACAEWFGDPLFPAAAEIAFIKWPAPLRRYDEGTVVFAQVGRDCSAEIRTDWNPPGRATLHGADMDAAGFRVPVPSLQVAHFGDPQAVQAQEDSNGVPADLEAGRRQLRAQQSVQDRQSVCRERWHGPPDCGGEQRGSTLTGDGCVTACRGCRRVLHSRRSAGQPKRKWCTDACRQKWRRWVRFEATRVRSSETRSVGYKRR